ncbi:MAG TPA: ABC transporter permease [Candidatus Binatia bacterium]|nr:ABC transporter permease [Candidatus Binatia bacterium]HEU4639612.1 ABC transporter permease [Candidatus Binatia bacterium]
MQIPLKYILRSSSSRRLTTVITILGIALVVFVFTAVLMMANGVEKTLRSTGSDDNLIVARKAAMSEIMSILDRDAAGIISNMPLVASFADGRPMSSKEAVVIINLNKIGAPGISNVIVRGVESAAFPLRPQVRIVQGRMFRWGAREVIAGAGITHRFTGAQIGEKMKFGGDLWTVVGIFEADGSGFESEVWGDSNQIMDAFKRSSFSTITMRLKQPDDLSEIAAAFESDNRLQYFVAKREKKFFEEQSEMMAKFIRILGIFVTIIFSTGATIGAMITMYGAVANRTVEIGTLRALGFFRRSILLAFLSESFVLSLAGGIAGLGLASLLQFFSISTLNFGSFSELAFSFALSPSIIATSLGFSLLMGLIGGFLPALRASRLNIIQALRAV